MALPPYAIEMIGHVLLFFMVFGMTATVDLDCVMKQLRNKRALFMGVTLQYVVLPFLGFLTVKMLALDNAMGLTLLVVTSSPGGSYSNWWCSIFNADLALSVTMTAISTILAVVMLPLNLCLYAPLVFNKEVDVVQLIDFRALMTSLVVVFSAIGLGIFASVKIDNHNFHIFANRFGSFAGIWLVLLSGFASNSIDGVQMWEREAKFYVGVAMPCVTALLISNAMTTYWDLKKPERVTSCIECVYQNCGIATSVALSMFQGEELAEAMGVPFFYGLVEFAVIGMYCLGAWKAGWTKAPPTEPLWKVITVNYEVLLAEKLADERENVEVQLGDSYVHVEAGDGYRNEEGGIGGSLGACLYYCHEPDLDDVDPPVKKVESTEEKKEKLAADPPQTSMKSTARRIFWESLGYKI